MAIRTAWPESRDGRLVDLWTGGATAVDVARTLTEEGFPCDMHKINARVSHLRDHGISLPAHKKGTAAGKVVGGKTIASMAPLPTISGAILWPESPTGCVWPLWPHDGPQGKKPRRFCGKKREAPARPYCSAHCRKAYTPARVR